jgi:hypothetical protein
MAAAFVDEPAADLVYGGQVEVNEKDHITKHVHAIEFDIRDFIYEISIIVHQQSAL